MFRVSLSLLGLCVLILGLVILAGGAPVLAILLITVGAAGAYLPLREEVAFARALHQINRKHGTRFSRSNGFGIHLRIYFDPENRKILITDTSTSRVEDFSVFKSWRLKWKSRVRLGHSEPLLEDFRIQMTHADPGRPDLEIRCRTKAEGESWHGRIGDLLNPPLTGGELRA